jgi:hypothetical protein
MNGSDQIPDFFFLGFSWNRHLQILEIEMPKPPPVRSTAQVCPKPTILNKPGYLPFMILGGFFPLDSPVTKC